MSKQAVDYITGMIVLDVSFREALMADPDQALSGFDLSEREKAWLKRIDYETMETLAQTLALCRSMNSPANRSNNLYLHTKRED